SYRTDIFAFGDLTESESNDYDITRSNLPIQSTNLVISTISSFLELPMTITNPNNSYISVIEKIQIQIPGN
ncbi:hypothetical protein ALC57_05147, partial [Trachymyrmex cornetzi]